MSRDIQNFGDYSVKGIKSFMGREGMGFNADLYRSGRKIGFAMDDASGGEIRVDWVDRSEEALLERHIASLPSVSTHGLTLKVSSDWFISELVGDFERERDIKKMRKQCETKTLYRKPNDGYGVYHIINQQCDERMRQHLMSKYGQVEIFNNVLAQGRLPSVLQQE